MNDIDQQGKQKSRWSKYITVLRVCIGIIAIIVVIRSVQWRDAVKVNDELLPIVEQTADSYRVVNDEGQTITIDRTSDDASYQPGVITIAQNLKTMPAIYGFVLFAAVPILLALRWRAVLGVHKVKIPFPLVLKLTYTGHFLNFFLIGTTGGDLIKAYWVTKFKCSRAAAFVSVFVDRFVGLVMLILTAGVFVAILWSDAQIGELAKPVAILAVMVLAMLVVLFSNHARRLVRFDRWSPKLPFAAKIKRIDEALLAYRRQPKSFIHASFFSVVLQLLVSTSMYFLGMALQMDAAIWYFWLYVPLAFLIGSIPISVFWGLGLLEGAYIAFFAGTGLATVTQAAMLAMAFRLVQLLWSIPGSIFLIGGLTPPRNDEENHVQQP